MSDSRKLSRSLIVALGALLLAPTVLPAVTTAEAARSSPGDAAWIVTYNSPSRGNDIALATTSSPDGAVVFVTGNSRSRLVTVAYDGFTGRELWVAHAPVACKKAVMSASASSVLFLGAYCGSHPGHVYLTAAYQEDTGVQLWSHEVRATGYGNEISMTPSPDGAAVYVNELVVASTGLAFGIGAYEAVSGDRLWFKMLHGPAPTNSIPRAIAVTPNGWEVLVTGSESDIEGESSVFLTAALGSSTGLILWAKRYRGSCPPLGCAAASATALTVAPDSQTLYVAGWKDGPIEGGSGSGFAMVSYSASTGAVVWIKRGGAHPGAAIYPSHLIDSADGSSLFVLGSIGPYAVGAAAYGAKSGQWEWATRLKATYQYGDFLPTCIQATPDGSALFVGTTSDLLAYDPASGGERWHVASGPFDSVGCASGLTGNRIYIAGAGGSPQTGQDYAITARSTNEGSLLWLRRYNQTGDADDVAGSVVVSPDGSTVFVTGLAGSTGDNFDTDAVTMAYDGVTGSRRWKASYEALGYDPAVAPPAWPMAVSNDGTRLFVALSTREGWLVLAYAAKTGKQVWTSAKYSEGDPAFGELAALAVSPDGSTVFATGTVGSITPGSFTDYSTVAYDSGTGAVMWQENTVPQFIPALDRAHAITVSPDGKSVFVTGEMWQPAKVDYARVTFGTVAYCARTGALEWTANYGGSAADEVSAAYSLAVSPDGTSVVVAGGSSVIGLGEPPPSSYATVAYDAGTGRQLWARRYGGGSGKVSEWATGVVISPDGSRAIVAGEGNGDVSLQEYGLVAYDLATGAQEWQRRFPGPQSDNVQATLHVAMRPDSSQVFVAGTTGGGSGELPVGALDADTGKQLWVRRPPASYPGWDLANGIAVNPTGSALYVTGGVFHSRTGADYATVAYGLG